MDGVIVVTGASSGIGHATCRRLLERGATVVAGARRTDRMQDLAEAGATVLGLDVTDPASIRSFVDGTLERHGRIDALVNNAGYGSYGALEEVPIEEARRQFEVNVFGLAQVTAEVLPAMRAQGSGRIINVSSMGGRIFFPMGGWYHATKHALEALSDALRLEVAPHGIQVVVIQPGAIESEWAGIADESLQATSGSGPYAAQAAAFSRVLESTYAGGRAASTDVVARAIERAIRARRPRLRYRIPWDAKALVMLRRVLPERTFDRLVRRVVR